MYFIHYYFLGYTEMYRVDDHPVPHPPALNEIPVIAQGCVQLWDMMQAGIITPRKLRECIPETLLTETGDAAKIFPKISTMGILTCTVGGRTRGLGAHVAAEYHGDISRAFGDQQSTNGMLEVRTPRGKARSAWVESWSVTTVPNFMPSVCAKNINSMVQRWFVYDRERSKAPFSAHADFDFGSTLVGPRKPPSQLAFNMKFFDDKIPYIEAALRHPSLNQCFLSGYDPLVWVEDLVLTKSDATAARGEKYWFTWTNHLSHIEPTKMIIFGWITPHGVMTLLSDAITIHVPRPVPGAMMGSGREIN